MASVGGSWIAGVDGCPGGWIAARQRIASGAVELAVHARFAELLDPADPPAVIAVDMPIGLPERIGRQGRGPERAVRPLLGRRRNCVFSIPARGAVAARDYWKACAMARANSMPRRAVSK